SPRTRGLGVVAGGRFRRWGCGRRGCRGWVPRRGASVRSRGGPAATAQARAAGPRTAPSTPRRSRRRPVVLSASSLSRSRRVGGRAGGRVRRRRTAANGRRRWPGTGCFRSRVPPCSRWGSGTSRGGTSRCRVGGGSRGGLLAVAGPAGAEFEEDGVDGGDGHVEAGCDLVVGDVEGGEVFDLGAADW